MQNRKIEVTLPISGRTVFLDRPRISMSLLALDIKKKIPEPTPPVQRIEVGDGQWTDEPNPLNPDYQRAKQAYERDVAMRIGLAMLNFSYPQTLTPEEQAEVQAYRAEYGEYLPLDGMPDWKVFYRYVVVQGEDDWQTMLAAVRRAVMPSEEAVQTHVATFPGDVQGAGPVQVPDAQK